MSSFDFSFYSELPGSRGKRENRMWNNPLSDMKKHMNFFKRGNFFFLVLNSIRK